MRSFYQAVRTQEAQLERDISMAREVQLRLLPSVAPTWTNADMAVRFLPARSIAATCTTLWSTGRAAWPSCWAT